MAWTQDQIVELCRIYSLNGFTFCPDCRTTVEIVKGPDDKESQHAVAFKCTSCGASTTQKFMTIQPKDFIRPPYAACPSCGREAYGLLMVSAHGYTKRCAECRFDKTYDLPPIKKTLIYLDQMAVSNLMFALNPDTKQFRAGKVDPFWRTAFEKLDQLAKLQLIVCPETEFQEQESLVHVHFEALRQIYEYLSDGVQFRDAATVERFQIHLHALNWFEGRPEEPPRLSRHDVLHGNPDEWQDIMRATARGRVTEEDIKALRADRDTVEERVQTIFGRWQRMKGFSFQDWFAFEIGVAGRQILEAWTRAVARWAEIQSGIRELSSEDMFTPPQLVLVTSLHREFENRGLTDDQAWAKVREYLASPSIVHVPSVKISAMLWTAIVRQAATGGRKKAPSRGVVNDIKLISTVLPYCDALFIDREMHGLLLEGPLASELDYGARPFSSRNPDEFLAYLDGIEEAASVDHLELTRQVYGEDRLKPYTSMFDPGGGRKQ